MRRKSTSRPSNTGQKRRVRAMQRRNIAWADCMIAVKALRKMLFWRWSGTPKQPRSGMLGHRTTWLGAYVYENPIATEYDASVTANVSTILGLTAGASYIYEHESGNNQADGTAISAFLTTGSVEIADGDELMSVSKLVPDFDNLTNNMTATLTLEQYPQSTDITTTSGTISSTTEKIDVRGRGRAVKIKYETNTVNDTAWRLGSTKLQLRPDGRR